MGRWKMRETRACTRYARSGENNRGMVNGVNICPRVPIERIPGRVGSHGSMSRALLHEVRWTIIVTRVLL